MAKIMPSSKKKQKGKKIVRRIRHPISITLSPRTRELLSQVQRGRRSRLAEAGIAAMMLLSQEGVRRVIIQHGGPAANQANGAISAIAVFEDREELPFVPDDENEKAIIVERVLSQELPSLVEGCTLVSVSAEAMQRVSRLIARAVLVMVTKQDERD